MDKNVDKKGRWRNITVAFRLSPEESEDLNIRVKLSGLTKQDYIVKRLSERDIVVQGNSRVYKALKTQMAHIHEELQRISGSSELSEEMLETLKLIAITLNGLKEV